MRKPRELTALAVIATAVAGGLLASGCTELEDDRDCKRPAPVVMFFGTDGHYHYGSPTGKVVPATKVPSSARTVPGYKAPAAPAVKAPAAPAVKAPPAVKVPAPPRPAPAPRLGKVGR